MKGNLMMTKIENRKWKIKEGFTLAEILITLGILGIVAGITIPGMVKDYRKKVYETANMVFEHRLAEAMRQMNINDELTGYKTTQDFVTALQKYMKIIRRCDFPVAHECFADKIGVEGDMINTSILQISDSFVETASQKWNTDIVGIILQNGHSALLAYNPKCTSSGITAKAQEMLDGTCLAKVWDTNGKKHPNQYGKDIDGDLAGKAFVVKMPSGLKITATDINFGAINTCATSSPYYRKNNESCKTDYWAGAMQACANLGMRAPNTGIANNVWGFFEYPKGTRDRWGGTALSTSNQITSGEARQLWEYCKTNSCFSVYWTSQVDGTNASCSIPMHIGLGQIGDSGGCLGANRNNSTSGAKLRCVMD